MTAGAQRLWIICYDIADDKRRAKVYKRMRGAGEHIQFSVFRCVLSELQLVELKTDLVDIIDGREDQVLFVPLGAAEVAANWGMYALGKPLARPSRTVKIV